MKKPQGTLLFIITAVVFIFILNTASFVPAQEAGEKISLDLRGVEISELFKILSRKSDLNIIPSALVKGRVNIFLNNITVENAIEIILVSQDLAVDRKENILYIMTAAEYQQTFGKKYYEKRKFKIFKLTAADPQAVFNVFSQIKSDIGKIISDPASGTVIVIDVPETISDMQQALIKLEQLQPQEIFELSYAKVEEVQGEVSKVLTPGSGMLQMDKRTNKLVVSDLPEKMRLIKDVISAFDESSPQVLIEADIVQVVLSDKNEYGVSWERIFSEPRLHGLQLAGKFYGGFPLQGSGSFSSAKQGYVSIGSVADDDYNVIVQFLKTVGTTNVLSRPRIAALNNEKAKILIGTKEAYITSTITGETDTGLQSETVEFIDVGIKLNVTPTVIRDDYISMKIKTEVSIVKEYFETKIGSRVPIVETSEAETVIKVKNGSMIMIGGLIKKEKVSSGMGLPFLREIPVLGFFFGSKLDSYKKTELVIFLRPRIITGDSTMLAKEESGKTISSKRPLKDFLR